MCLPISLRVLCGAPVMEGLTDMSENLAGVPSTGTPGGGEKAGAIHVRELGYDRANP